MNRHNHLKLGSVAIATIVLLIAAPIWVAAAEKPNIL